MARFKLFPRHRRPSLGELLGISQAERQVRIARDPSAPLKNTERHAKRRAGYDSGPMEFARFLRRLFG
jgi:hypothetical protein